MTSDDWLVKAVFESYEYLILNTIDRKYCYQSILKISHMYFLKNQIDNIKNLQKMLHFSLLL